MTAQLNRILLYVKDIPEVTDFYIRHFGFEARHEDGDRIVELVHPDGGARLMLYQAAKSVREGQVTAKLVFDVADVPAFCDAARQNGLAFGSIHKADGYCFANAKDPAKNSISISSKAFRSLP